MKKFTVITLNEKHFKEPIIFHFLAEDSQGAIDQVKSNDLNIICVFAGHINPVGLGNTESYIQHTRRVEC